MAEQTTATQLPTGQGTNPSPGTTDPGNVQTADQTTIVVEVPPASTDAADPRDAELQQLRQQNERYKANMHGWEQQSARNKQEMDQLKTQLAQTNQALQMLSGALPNQSSGQVHSATTARAQPKDLAEAMGRYLAGDDTALQGIPLTHQTRPDDVVPIVQQVLGNYVGFLDRQNAVMAAFPELQDRASPLYKDIYDAYDQMVQSPLAKLYKDDPEMQIPLTAPDGSAQRQVDLRLLKDAALHVRAQRARDQGAQDENRRAAVGDTMAGNGRQTQGQQQHVEAIRLLTDGEMKQLREMITTKAWPRDWPKDERAAAKFYFDGLPEAQKAERIAAYHGARR